MRRTVVPGLLRSVAHNQAHGVSNIQLYEIGTVGVCGPRRRPQAEGAPQAGVRFGGRHERQGLEHRSACVRSRWQGRAFEAIARELAQARRFASALSAEDALICSPVARPRCFWWRRDWLRASLHPLAIAAYDAEGPVVAFELDMAALERTPSGSRLCRRASVPRRRARCRVRRGRGRDVREDHAVHAERGRQVA